MDMARSSGYRADSPISTSIEVDDYDGYNDYDDPKRRISNITATSVSSFPDSAWPSDSDVCVPGPHCSTLKPRSTYRVGSLRRSPLPNDRLSPSSLRPPKHTSRRPRSRGEGGRPRSRGEDVVHHEMPRATQPDPLVLLHVTLLPPRLPWNRSVLDAALSTELKHQFGVLRAATSGLVSQRGILIAHPREEFEILEERVLETLDLLPERIGYDGQYRPRTPNTIMQGEEDEEDEAELRACDTCMRLHVGSTGGWLTRVYAANGLMRAGAWSACWSEMERVDVEVRPCIPEHVCRKLDEMQVAEDNAAKGERHNQTVQPIHEMQTTKTPEQQRIALLPTPTQNSALISTEPHSNREEGQITTLSTLSETTPHHNDLPPIYQAKDVPLGLLLRNYLYLVLQDRRNLAISFLVLTLLVSTAYGTLASQGFKETNISTFEAKVELASESLPLSPSSRIDVGHGKRHPMWTGKVKVWDASKTDRLEPTNETTAPQPQVGEAETIEEGIDPTSQTVTEVSASTAIETTYTSTVASGPSEATRPKSQEYAISPDKLRDGFAVSPNPAYLPATAPCIIDCCPVTQVLEGDEC